MNRKVLKKLGLSNLEIRTYQLLADGQAKTARRISKEMGVSTEAIYRPLRNLKAKGLVVSKDKHPAHFFLLPQEVGLNNLLKSFFDLAQQLTPKTLKSDLLPFQAIIDRRTYHQKGKQLFKKVQKEVLVIASGTGELSPEFIRTKFEATKTGVIYKILALTYQDLNREKIKSWQKIGFQVRHKKGEELNLVIYDRELIQIGLRTDKESREKIGFIIKNKTLAEFLGEFYDYLWKTSQKV